MILQVRYELYFLCLQCYSKPKNFRPWKDQYYFKVIKILSKTIENAKIYKSFFWKNLITLNFRTVKRCKHLPDLSSFKLFGFFSLIHWAIFGNLLCSSAFFRANQYSKQMRDDVLIWRCYLGLEWITVKCYMIEIKGLVLY